MSDSPAYQRLVDVAACLCIAIEESDLLPVCFCGVVPGAIVSQDYVNGGCDDRDGMAWVRLVDQFAYDAFPLPSETPARCSLSTAISIEMGMVRSVPIDESGEPPSADTYQALAYNQMLEMDLMRNAITCCVEGNVGLGTYTPVGPAGGAVGGFWSFVVSTLEED